MGGLWVVVLAGLLACGDKEEEETGLPTGGTDGGSEDGGGVDDCWTTRPDACAATPGCTELLAREVVSDGAGGWCVDYDVEREVVGCMPADVDCGSAMTYATPPALPDSCYEFGSTCTTAGWGACADPDMTQPEACAR